MYAPPPSPSLSLPLPPSPSLSLSLPPSHPPDDAAAMMMSHR